MAHFSCPASHGTAPALPENEVPIAYRAPITQRRNCHESAGGVATVDLHQEAMNASCQLLGVNLGAEVEVERRGVGGRRV